jgi:hypothetical protein
MEDNNFLEVAEQEIERQNGNIESRQPRLSETSPEQFYLSVLRFGKLSYMDQPEYKSDSRHRDKWLTEIWKMEPNLAGVINSVVAIDKNRGWSLIGGRNLVRRYTNILHNAENGAGYRAFTSLQSQSFYSTDMGGIAEVGRDGEQGPMQALWYVDPARCTLKSNLEFPLTYYPSRGKKQLWRNEDYFRTSSLPSTDETYNQLGFCAISRAVALIQTLIAVHEYDQEQLGARAPQGLLLLHGIAQDQWDQAMRAREADLTRKERMYYGGVEVLASLGQEKIDANLVALSNLPANFDMRTFVDLTMYGYALCFGYDPTEFWPVQFGALGRGRESEVQHMKATGKGGLDFILAYQENVQKELPPTIHFEFDQRDEEAELVEAEVAAAKEAVVTSMYESGLQFGQPLISREEARSLLAANGLIPREWTEAEEESEATDIEAVRQRARELPEIQQFAYQHPKESLVIYEWPKDRQKILWYRAEDMLRHKYQPIAKTRQEEDEILYEDEESGVIITEDDVESAIENADEDVKPFLEAEEIEGEENEQ